jgi:hypothetical protein
MKLSVPLRREFLAASSAVIMGSLWGSGSIDLSLLGLNCVQSRLEDIDEVADIISLKPAAICRKLQNNYGLFEARCASNWPSGGRSAAPENRL